MGCIAQLDSTLTDHYVQCEHAVIPFGTRSLRPVARYSNVPNSVVPWTTTKEYASHNSLGSVQLTPTLLRTGQSPEYHNTISPRFYTSWLLEQNNVHVYTVDKIQFDDGSSVWKLERERYTCGERGLYGVEPVWAMRTYYTKE